MMNLMMMMLTIMFMTTKHPLSLGIIIIAQTLNIAMMTGMYMGTFWFSYIIVITMISGMLVLFIYMASVASNEKFLPSIKLSMTMFLMIMISSITQYIYPTEKMEQLNIKTDLNVEDTSLLLLFNTNSTLLTMTMVLYLLFSMTVISYIVNIYEGPLRTNK
uniref:NADH dehydrogenase subunit 6 n=1 Tax=Neolethaeus assamensis TaxID=1589711 RepID=A0A343ISH5_9HEMI|nr:NADH dehydrogenase subunit 6 [Neolethaeus assamensis]AST10200.1 NADH dehydrogenase subunit 6 [Neolethaeus assamensis]